MTKRLCAVLVVMSAFASGCTMTLPEHGRSLSVGPAANPNSRETPPQPMSLGRSDDNATASR
jgi:hypothetical protein